VAGDEMTQLRTSYAFNPDLPPRRWHQKWINPIISLQNTPPASHGAPAPTKEDGEFGKAGFKIRTWVPIDEDDDVNPEELEQEVDPWSKPGAPIRPDLREKAAPPVVVEPEVMQIDEPQQTVAEPDKEIPVTDGVAEPVASEKESVEVPQPQPPQEEAVQPDTEMPDVQVTPTLPTEIPESTTLSTAAIPPEEPSTTLASPPPETAESVAPAEPPSQEPPTEMEDVQPPSVSSSPSDPVAQAQDVATGLKIESTVEQVENEIQAGSGAGGGIAGEGIAGGITQDFKDVEGTTQYQVEEVTTAPVEAESEQPKPAESVTEHDTQQEQAVE